MSIAFEFDFVDIFTFLILRKINFLAQILNCIHYVASFGLHVAKRNKNPDGDFCNPPPPPPPCNKNMIIEMNCSLRPSFAGNPTVHSSAEPQAQSSPV